MDFIGLQKLSLVDFDGKLACTLFTAGCNFRCPFCHNSEIVEFDKEAKTYSMEEILNFLDSRKGLLDAVVISGGEPTLMPDLKEKIIQIKKMGFLIKLDTNGTNPDLLIDLVESKLVDYVAMDIKNNLEDYYEIIGKKLVDQKSISKSINYLLKSNIDYEFRTTLVGEYHDFKNIEKIATLLAGAKKYCLQKFVNNEHCFAKNLHEVDVNKAKEFKKYLEAKIDNVILRGYDK